MKSIVYLVSFLLLSSFSLVDANDGETKAPSWNIEGSFYHVSNANFKASSLSVQDISFSKSAVTMTRTKYLENNDTGIIALIGYERDEVSWAGNPEFSEKTYNNAIIGIGGFTGSKEDWLWRGNAYVSFDTVDVSFGDNAIYGGMLWGSYNVKDNIDAHIGMMGNFRIRKDEVTPIIGVSWRPIDYWSINAVYPVDLSIRYDLDDGYTLELAWKIVRSRHRLKQEEVRSEGIFEYRTSGTELALVGKGGPYKTRVFVGYTGGGYLKVSDQYGNDSTSYKFNGSMYSGISLNIEF